MCVCSYSECLCVTQGDTGGPIVKYERRGDCYDPELMGVISCPPGGECGSGNQGPHVNVYTYRQWIKDVESQYQSTYLYK